jgi:hypothetical protein
VLPRWCLANKTDVANSKEATLRFQLQYRSVCRSVVTRFMCDGTEESPWAGDRETASLTCLTFAGLASAISTPSPDHGNRRDWSDMVTLAFVYWIARLDSGTMERMIADTSLINGEWRGNDIASTAEESTGQPIIYLNPHERSLTTRQVVMNISAVRKALPQDLNARLIVGS